MSNLRTDRIRSACGNCEKRSQDCHAHCETYAAEVILSTLISAEQNREKKRSNEPARVYERRLERLSKKNYFTKKRIKIPGQR